MASKIEIPLKTNLIDRKIPQNFRDTFFNEYAERYLSTLGANPTRENRKFIRKYASLKESVLLPVWVKDTLVILPNRSDDPDTIDLTDVFKTEVDIDDGVNRISKELIVAARKEKTGVVKKKSFKEVLNVKPIRYLKSDNRISWRRSNLCACLAPLIAQLSISDLVNKDFLQLLNDETLDENALIRTVYKFTSNMKVFVPMISEDLGGSFTQGIAKCLLSPLFLHFYGLFYDICYIKILHACSELCTKRLEKVNYDMYIQVTLRGKLIKGLSEQNDGTYHETEVDETALMSYYEQCVAKLLTRFSGSRFALKASSQAFVYATAFVVLDLLCTQYIWLNPINSYSEEMNELRKHTMKLLADTMTDLIDPSRLFPMDFLFRHHATFHPELEKSFIDRKPFKNKKARLFITSLPVRAVFTNAISVDSRKILQMNRPLTVDPTSRQYSRIHHVLESSSRTKTKAGKDKAVRHDLGRIDQLFKAFDDKLRNRAFQTLTAEQNVVVDDNNDNKSILPSIQVGRERGKETHYCSSNVLIPSGFTFMFSEDEISQPNDPKLSPSAQSSILDRILEKSRAQYLNKGGKDVRMKDPRLGILSPVDPASDQWSSKGTRTGTLELANDSTRYPTRPPSRDTPIVAIPKGFKPRPVTRG